MARTHEDDFVRLTNRVQAPYKTSEVMSSMSSESGTTHPILSGTMGHLVVALITVCALTFSSALAEEMYTTKFDNVDVDAIISNDRLLNGYVGCLLDRNPCTPDAAELKKNLPDALEHDCAGCSEAQKNAADKISHHLIDNKPDEWKLLEDKYDSTGAYRRRYLENKSREGDRVD